MKEFELGQRVVITDYLKRIEMDSRCMPELAKVWDGIAPEMRNMYVIPGARVSVWVPNSILGKFRATDCTKVQVGDVLPDKELPYHNPKPRGLYNPSPFQIDLPHPAVVTYHTALFDGYVEKDAVFEHYEKYPLSTKYEALRWYRAYQISYSIEDRPVFVLPSMIETD